MKNLMCLSVFVLVFTTGCDKERDRSAKYGEDKHFTWILTTGYRYDSLSTHGNDVTYASVNSSRNCDIVATCLKVPPVNDGYDSIIDIENDSIFDLYDLRIDINLQMISGEPPILQLDIIDPYGANRAMSQMYYLKGGKETITYHIPADLDFSKGWIHIFLYNYDSFIKEFVPRPQTYSMTMRVRDIE